MRESASSGSTGRSASFFAALIAAVAAAVAGGAGVTRHGLTAGEAATAFAARMHLHPFAHLVGHVDLVHATYYRLMHLVVQLGGGIVAMRMVCLVATVAAAALLAVLGTRLSGSAVTGGIGGLLFALCPTVDADAKSARSYGIVPLFIVVTIMLVLWALTSTESTTRKRMPWVLYGVVMLATVYLHELSLLLVVALAVVLVLLRATRRAWLAWLTASAAVVVLALPLIYYSHREDRAVAWITSPGIRGLLTTAHTFSGPSNVALAVFAIGAAAALVAGVLSWRSEAGLAPGNRLLLAVAGPVAVVPAVLLVAESAIGIPLFSFRYVSYYQPAAALLAGHGLVCIGRWVVRAVAVRRVPNRRLIAAGAIAVGVAGVAVALVPQLPLESRLTSARGYYRDYGAVVRQIDAHSRPGDGVAYLPPNLRYLPDGYPQLTKLNDYALRRTPTQRGNFQGRNYSAKQVTIRIAALQRIWVISKPGSKWLNPRLEAQRNDIRQGFRAVRRWNDHGVLLALWVRRTPTT